MNGVLVVDKPSGMTSHDVVDIVRRLARTRRVGHTGTLDPLATGVLVLLVGPATRLSRFVTESTKVYRGVVRFGETTTTYDADGEIVERWPVDLDLATVRALLPHFHGEILQIPPAYAAVKVRGKRAYALARQGHEVALEPRPVTIHTIEVLKWNSPDLTIEVVCSPGTYIRSLAHDLGQKAGSGAHLLGLRRTATGHFTLEDARTIEGLEELRAEGRFAEALLPPHAALCDMPMVALTPAEEQVVRYGQVVALEPPGNPDRLQAHNQAGQLVAVLRRLEDGSYRPILVLTPSIDEAGDSRA